MESIKQKNLKNDTELLAPAETQSQDGFTDLKAFIAKTPKPIYKELISKTWKLAAAPQELT